MPPLLAPEQQLHQLGALWIHVVSLWIIPRRFIGVTQMSEAYDERVAIHL